MKLNKLLSNIKYKSLRSFTGVCVNGISVDSRQLKDKDLFVAIKGEHNDSHNNVDRKLACKVSALVVDEQRFEQFCRLYPDLAVIGVKDTKQAARNLAKVFYKDKISGLKLIGVTGTNGKTTTAFYIRHILARAGFKAGLIGTISYYLPEMIIPALNTTPDLPVLYSYLARIKSSGWQFCVMEVSSHSLAQARVEGLEFERAVFCNLSRDHLDFHKNFKSYFQAKKELFKKLAPKTGVSLVNCDDEYGKRLIGSIKSKVISFGLSGCAQFKATNLKLGLSGASFKICYKGKSVDIRTKTCGIHNVYNVLAACACGISLGIELKHLKQAVNDLSGVKGRFQMISRKPFVFIDYAHTPKAIQTVLQTARGLNAKGRIITVFGCGGDRDKLKRPQMGRIAARLSDVVIITDDNPRSEDPGLIIKDIKEGIKKTRSEVFIERDRARAIRQAIAGAFSDDLVIIAGKGHEKGQIYEDRVISFSDIDQAREAVKELKGQKCLI